MLWLAMLALAFDLGSVKSEPKLEKRSEMALEYANTALDRARDSYREGHFEQTQDALGEVQDAVAICYDSLIATGKNPRKSSKPFKNAEKATRELLRRLAGLRDLMSAVDHPVLDPVVAKISKVHDVLLTAIMSGN